MIRFAAFAAASLFCLLTGQAQADFGCAVIGTSDAIVLAADGRQLALPAQLKNCEGLRLARGNVVACAQDHRERRYCRSFGKDTNITADKLIGRSSGGPWLVALLDLLGG